MAESFSKVLGDVDPRSAQFIQRGTKGVDPVEAVSGFIESGLESAKAQREQEQTTAALSSFQEQRTRLNEQVRNTQAQIRDLTGQIANASDRAVAEDLARKLDKLQRGGAAGASLSALRARRGQLLSQFMAAHPALRQDFAAIDKVISGQDNDIAATPTSTAFDAEQARVAEAVQKGLVHGLTPEQVQHSERVAIQLQMEQQERELNVLQGKKAAGEVMGVSAGYADSYIQQMHIELNAQLQQAKGQFGAEGLPPEVIAELKTRYKQGIRANQQFNSYIGKLGTHYDSQFITQQRNDVYAAVDAYVDNLFDSKNILTVLENQRKVVGEVAVANLYRGLPDLMKATVALDPTAVQKIAFETYPKMVGIARQNGGTIELMQRKYDLMLQNNAKGAEDVGIALQWARQHGSVNAMIGHYTSLMSGQANLLGYKKGNAAQDQLLAQGGQQMAVDLAADNPQAATTIVGDIINDAGKGNIPVLRNLLKDDTIRMAQSNPQVHQGIKNHSQTWVVRASNTLGMEMARDQLKFEFTPQLQAVQRRDRGLGRVASEPALAFSASSTAQFQSPAIKDQVKALNYTYAYIHRVEGQEAADTWAAKQIEELNNIGDTKRANYLRRTGKIAELKEDLMFIDDMIYWSAERKAARRAEINAELDKAIAEVEAQLKREGITESSEAQSDEQ